MLYCVLTHCTVLNVNRYIGEAESNIRNLFKDAELEWKDKLVTLVF
jgi:hypothetical protein